MLVNQNQLPAEIKKYSNMPIKAIPKPMLERFELPFMNYLSTLLNLKEDNAENLELCVPVILDMNRLYTFEQIKKMFELYVDSRLNVQPISNYIDRILIGKIKAGYTDYLKKSNHLNTKPKKVDKNGKELTQEESYKRESDIIQACEWFESYLHLERLQDNAVWVYDFLIYEKIIQVTDEEKKAIFLEIKTENVSKDEAVLKSKLTLLKGYFNFLKSKQLTLHSVLKF